MKLVAKEITRKEGIKYANFCASECGLTLYQFTMKAKVRTTVWRWRNGIGTPEHATIRRMETTMKRLKKSRRKRK